MKKLVLCVCVVLLVIPVIGQMSSISQPTAEAGAQVTVSQECRAEVKWNMATNLRRGPGGNYGIHRLLRWDNAVMRVFGRDEAAEWYQVELQEPQMVGWVWIDNINLYGVCANIPVVGEIDPDQTTAPPPPSRLALPEFAIGLPFLETDELYLLNDGMIYLRRQTQNPLVQLHMVIADLDAPQLRVESYIGAIPNNNVVLISEMVAQTGAFVAINGDFYGGNYMPQGLTVIDGEVVTAPKFRATFAITEDREPFIGYFTRGWTWNASVEAENGAFIPLQLMNLPCDPRWLCLYSDAVNGLPMRVGFDQLRVLLSPTLEVISIGPAIGYLEIPEDHYVLHGGLYTSTGEWLTEHVEIGDTLVLNLDTDPAWQDYEYAISGGPIIVQDGVFRQDCDPAVPEGERECEEFDDAFRQTHYFGAHTPRTAIGYNTAHNVLMLVMVEGYDIDHSDGMTQEELANLFIEFGAENAMEFDGGGSSSMWIDNGFVNDFPPRGERKLSNALMLFWDEE